MRNMQAVPFAYGALKAPDFIDAVALTTANQAYAIPTGAVFLIFSANVDFYARYASTVAATVPSTGVTGGGGSELNPTIRHVGGSTSGEVQLISPSTAGVLTIAAYKP